MCLAYLSRLIVYHSPLVYQTASTLTLFSSLNTDVLFYLELLHMLFLCWTHSSLYFLPDILSSLLKSYTTFLRRLSLVLLSKTHAFLDFLSHRALFFSLIAFCSIFNYVFICTMPSFTSLYSLYLQGKGLFLFITIYMTRDSGSIHMFID